ncbi:MAG: undecaprenyl-diphosphate phosphatase [Planctomycetota bacterium]
MNASARASVVVLLALWLWPALAVAAPAEHPDATSEISMGDAIVLGVVEGITEYLPISSTGHLILTERILGIPGSHAAHAFVIFIQAGAIVAVLLLYRARVAVMVRGLLGRDPAGRRLVLAVAAASLPAAVVGLLLDDWIEENLFGLRPVVAAWITGGLAILLFARSRRGRRGPRIELEALTWHLALLVGIAQCLALWPGTSRSLVTIVGGLLVGLNLAAAVEFSFLVGVVVLGGATAYKAVQSGADMVGAYGASTLVVGFLAAAVSAVLAVRWLVAWVSRHGLLIFGWYRVLLGLLVFGLVLAGVL